MPILYVFKEFISLFTCLPCVSQLFYLFLINLISFFIFINFKVGDWLQGPHVYALYQSYNMTKHEIEILFIAGFGSSMLFGTIVGSFADKL